DRRRDLQHGTELKLRGGLDASEGFLVRRAGDGDHDVLGALRVDLGLRDTGGVDTRTDDLDGLSELLTRHLLTALELRGQDDLGAALEVERELRGPAGTLPDCSRSVEADEADDDYRQPGQRTPGLLGRGRSWCCHLEL